MARIELVDIAHTYQASRPGKAIAHRSSLLPEWALKPMTTSWTDSGAYALLGPSGCGKTTLLNIISGLIKPTHGRILFDGRDVTGLEPQQRNIAQVFQFPVIYDTMTVFDNLAFPLRNRQWKPADIRKRVHEIAEILELTTDLPQRARGLSADAKQKIALGRGLVRPDVAAILFDEPLTVIDPHLKWLLRRKLKQIHHQLKLSLIYVTHDQTEALTFADMVMVMTHGEIVQTGTPQELFESPAHRFVGHFIGTPGMNFLNCAWDGTAVVGNARIATSSTSAPSMGGELAIGIRPEFVEVHEMSGTNCLPATVTAVHDQGVHVMVRLQLEDSFIWAKLRDRGSIPETGLVHAYLPVQHCALYENARRLQ